MQSRIESFLTENRISKADLARALDVDYSTLARRIARSSAWKLGEVTEALAYFTKILKRPVSFDEVFATAEAPAELVGRDSGSSAA